MKKNSSFILLFLIFYPLNFFFLFRRFKIDKLEAYTRHKKRINKLRSQQLDHIHKKSFELFLYIFL